MDQAQIADPRAASALRVWVCVGTVLACLPYLLLKVAWALGWSVGASGSDFADTTRVANLLTAALELVAITVAVTFVAPWGRRVPAFLVVFPTWVATGLLAPVAVAMLLGVPAQLVTGGGNPFTADDVLAPWVFVLVYGGFAVQSVLLPAGFVLHAADRWPVVTDGGRDDAGAGPTRALQKLLGGVFVVAAAAFTVQQVSWAALGGGAFAEPEATQRVFLVVGALAAAAGAASMLSLMRGRRLTGSHLALLWLGTAVTFSSTFVDTLKSLTIAPGSWGALSSGPAERSLTLLILLGAIGGAIGATVRLVEEVDDSPRAVAIPR